MKKVKLNLSLYQLEYTIRLLEHVLASPVYYGYHPRDHHDKLILACLGELFYKLNNAHNPFTNNYKLKISVAQGIAFLMHGLSLPAAAVSDALTLNHVIGLIDQQLFKTPKK